MTFSHWRIQKLRLHLPPSSHHFVALSWADSTSHWLSSSTTLKELPVNVCSQQSSFPRWYMVVRTSSICPYLQMLTDGTAVAVLICGKWAMQRAVLLCWVALGGSGYQWDCEKQCLNPIEWHNCEFKGFIMLWDFYDKDFLFCGDESQVDN